MIATQGVSAGQGVRVVFVGSYTEPPAGRGPGVTTALLDLATGALTVADEVAVPNPSYLVAHPAAPVVYAVDERSGDPGGAVSVLRRGDDGKLALVDRHPTGSDGPCHLAITPDLGHLLTAEYVGGGLSAFALEPDGTVVGRTDAVRHEPDGSGPRGGLGPVADRQDAPHVHMVVPEPDGPGAAGTVVHAVDLGTDEIRTYGLDRDGRLVHRTTSRVAPGTGPRQLLRLPAAGPGRYALAGELAATLTLLELADGAGFRTVATVPATTTAAPPDVPTNPAHLALAPGGQLLLSTRGPDVLTAFDVAGSQPRTVAETGTGGRWPRQFAVVDRFVLVCDEFDDRVVVLEADPATGALRPTGQQLDVGTPACVVAAP